MSHFTVAIILRRPRTRIDVVGETGPEPTPRAITWLGVVAAVTVSVVLLVASGSSAKLSVGAGSTAHAPGSVGRLGVTPAGAASAADSRTGPAADYSRIRAVSIYDQPDAANAGAAAFTADLKRELPAVKKTGFNTVWLVTPWYMFEPHPFAAPHRYNEAAFANLRRSLAVIRSFGLQAILSPQYLGPGWTPSGIHASTWLSDPSQYAAFETYTLHFLSELRRFSGMLYVQFFTETTLDNRPTCEIVTDYQSSQVIDNCPARGSNEMSYCQAPPGGPVPSNCLAMAAEHAALLRRTIGSLPGYLEARDARLRAKFRLGYHDGDYFLGNLLIPASYKYSPVPRKPGYDFLSLSNYTANKGLDWARLSKMLDRQLHRYQMLYPSKPVVVGEFGASMCSGTRRQARIDSQGVSYFLAHHVGFNVWGWRAPTKERCTDTGNGLYLLNNDGTARPALAAVRAVLRGAPS